MRLALGVWWAPNGGPSASEDVEDAAITFGISEAKAAEPSPIPLLSKKDRRDWSVEDSVKKGSMAKIIFGLFSGFGDVQIVEGACDKSPSR